MSPSPAPGREALDDSLHTEWGAGKGTGLRMQCKFHRVTNLCPHRAIADAMALAQCLLVGGNLETLLSNGIRYVPKDLLPSSNPRKP